MQQPNVQVVSLNARAGHMTATDRLKNCLHHSSWLHDVLPTHKSLPTGSVQCCGGVVAFRRCGRLEY